MAKVRYIIRAKVLPDGPTVCVNGREAWSLKRLIEAGEKGVSSIEQIGPRLSAYIFDLRGMGLVIETERVPHGGRFPGNHAVYRLKSAVEIISESEAA